MIERTAVLKLLHCTKYLVFTPTFALFHPPTSFTETWPLLIRRLQYYLNYSGRSNKPLPLFWLILEPHRPCHQCDSLLQPRLLSLDMGGVHHFQVRASGVSTEKLFVLPQKSCNRVNSLGHNSKIDTRKAWGRNKHRQCLTTGTVVLIMLYYCLLNYVSYKM